MMPRLGRRQVAGCAIAFIFVALPFFAAAIGSNYLIIFASRIVIYAILAVSLELLVGRAGLVSFGHALYFGLGGYVVALAAFHLDQGIPILGWCGSNEALLVWPLAMLVSGLAALAFGALSLRTTGVYFIMITLAFAQMVYYVAIGLDRYGGDDGMTIYKRSQFGDWINLSNKTAFYYLCLGLLLVTVYLVWRIVNSRFGMVIQGARSNDRRMRAIGFPTYRYKLVCFVIAGAICGLAGALLANHTDFISPAIMHWTRSGDLIVMAVLGGMGTVLGPVLGAVALLSFEEALPVLIRTSASPLIGGDAAAKVAEYWQIVLGPLFLAVVLFARGGIDGLLAGIRRG